MPTATNGKLFLTAWSIEVLGVLDVGQIRNREPADVESWWQNLVSDIGSGVFLRVIFNLPKFLASQIIKNILDSNIFCGENKISPH